MISFHPIIQSNYVEVHEWLSRQEELPDYRKNNAWDKVKKKLKDATLESAALQYYVLFPAHFAKVAFASIPSPILAVAIWWGKHYAKWHVFNLLSLILPF